jgi:ribosomal protein L14E/L6E/L27E
MEEKLYLMDVVIEKGLNKEIYCLQENLKRDGTLYIPKLTSNVGNCLFESLEILGDGEAEQIRKNVSAIMTLSSKDESFFPHIHQSLRGIFTNSNDIATVLDKDEEKAYKYNYDMMLVDLYSKHTWSRLPTELILMVISRIFKIEILIYHNNTQYVSKVNVWDDIQIIATIRLGQLNEEHYVPIKQITDTTSGDLVSKKIKYVKAKNRFHKWAKELVININESAKIKETIIQNHLSKLEEDTKECDLEDFIFID